MEPRPEGRGDSGLHTSLGTTTACFNGAAARRPRRRRSKVLRLVKRFALQWSRGPKAAETSYYLLSILPMREASMEPRPEGRGDVRVTVEEVVG